MIDDDGAGSLRAGPSFNDFEGSTMATAYATVEVWVLVDQGGDYVAHHDPDLLKDLYEEHIQGIDAAEGTRRVKVTLRVPLPAVIEVSGEVATTEEVGELKAV